MQYLKLVSKVTIGVKVQYFLHNVEEVLSTNQLKILLKLNIVLLILIFNSIPYCSIESPLLPRTYSPQDSVTTSFEFQDMRRSPEVPSPAHVDLDRNMVCTAPAPLTVVRVRLLVLFHACAPFHRRYLTTFWTIWRSSWTRYPRQQHSHRKRAKRKASYLRKSQRQTVCFPHRASFRGFFSSGVIIGADSAGRCLYLRSVFCRRPSGHSATCWGIHLLSSESQIWLQSAGE